MGNGISALFQSMADESDDPDDLSLGFSTNVKESEIHQDLRSQISEVQRDVNHKQTQVGQAIRRKPELEERIKLLESELDSLKESKYSLVLATATEMDRMRSVISEMYTLVVTNEPGRPSTVG